MKDNKNIINVGSETQFFLDNLFIAEAKGVTLKINLPQKAGMVLSPEREWEEYRIFSEMVIEDSSVYHMWYTAFSKYKGSKVPVACPRCDLLNDGRKVVCKQCGWPLPDIDWMYKNLYHKCYATSTDGIHWERPDLGLVEYEGSKKNNIFEFTGPMCVPSINPLGPPEEKFMAISEYKGNLYISVSQDGLRWKMKTKSVLPFSADTNNQIIYDSALGKYVAFLRGFPGRRTTVRCEFDNLDQAPWPYEDYGHQPDKTGTVYLTDELETVMDVDEYDPVLPGLDINAINACLYADGVYLGFPSLYRKYPPSGLDQQGRENHRYFAQANDGTFDVQLAVSRDGHKWHRHDRRSYLSPGLFGGTDGGFVSITPGLLHCGNKVYQYYGGKCTTHGIFDPGTEIGYGSGGSIFCLIQLKDRFISISTNEQDEGWFITPLCVHSGRTLELNIDCGGLGETIVQILDEQGHAIQGFTRLDCDPVDLNHLQHTVTWRGNANVGVLAGKPVRLEFFMRGSKLFTFKFAAE